MLDFEVQKFTRHCAATQRELKPGEVFFSVLVPRGADVVRLDYAADAWPGPPGEALGWWKSEVADPQARGISWAPSDVMLHYFQQLYEQQEKEDSCYVLALLMIRRRIFKLEASETDDQGREVLVVYCPRNEREYRVRVTTPPASRVEAIQQELAELLCAQKR